MLIINVYEFQKKVPFDTLLSCIKTCQFIIFSLCFSIID